MEDLILLDNFLSSSSSENSDDENDAIMFFIPRRERRRIPRINNYIETVIVRYNNNDFKENFHYTKNNVFHHEKKIPCKQLTRNDFTVTVQQRNFERGPDCCTAAGVPSGTHPLAVEFFKQVITCLFTFV
ncbi:uncharacterized protein LOC116417084 [Nasonia vitripennis]|uniref:Uncharacterized protein n=1 Tax=Nasonia vitripennis TaxID=7425 RepID=A0A7M7QCT7_NASVI|nr:uncharacterized protein LOC116417084 [Nasonia vitripennis]